MQAETLEQIIKDDDQGLLNVEGVSYGVYYQGSYWTGGSPAQALVRLFQEFPRYRISKELAVYKINRHAGTNCVSRCYESKGFLYTVEELRSLRAKTRKQVA